MPHGHAVIRGLYLFIKPWLMASFSMTIPFAINMTWVNKQKNTADYIFTRKVQIIFIRALFQGGYILI